MEHEFDNQLPDVEDAVNTDPEQNIEETVNEITEQNAEENEAVTVETEKEQEQVTAYTDPNAGAAYSVPGTENTGNYVYGSSESEQKNEQPEPAQNYSYGNSADNNYTNNNYAGSNYGQAPYQSMPNYSNQQTPMDESPLPMGEWILVLLVAMVPCFGLIMYIIWAFGNSGNVNRKNFCRAQLIIMAITYVVVFIFMAIAGIGLLVGISQY